MNRALSYAILVGALITSSVSVPAMAQDKDVWSGNALLPACKRLVAFNDGQSIHMGNDSGTVDAGICTGLFNALMYYGGWMDPSHKFCAPDGVSSIQLMRVAIKYLDEHPEYMHFDLRASALVAMTKAFPCKR